MLTHCEFKSPTIGGSWFKHQSQWRKSRLLWKMSSPQAGTEKVWDRSITSNCVLKVSSGGGENVSCSGVSDSLWPHGGSGRSPEEGNGNPLQYSHLENSMDRETWWVPVYELAKSWTRLSTHSLTHSKPQCNGIWRKILWKVIRMRWGREGEIFLWD